MIDFSSKITLDPRTWFLSFPNLPQSYSSDRPGGTAEARCGGCLGAVRHIRLSAQGLFHTRSMKS